MTLLQNTRSTACQFVSQTERPDDTRRFRSQLSRKSHQPKETSPRKPDLSADPVLSNPHPAAKFRKKRGDEVLSTANASILAQHSYPA
jgi:hypothetical protein